MAAGHRRGFASAIAGGVIGSYFNLFDFLIASFAASLVWPVIFFKGFSPSAALAYSTLSFALPFVVRPFGALVWGHFGDRIGRRTGLMWTMVLCGISSLGIALLPGYSAIGLSAPILLLILRLLSGFSLGGELGNAFSYVGEIKSRFRVLFTGFNQTITTLAIASGSFLFAAIAFLMPRAAFVDYGWRFAFVAGFVVAIIGLVIRFRLIESPEFLRLQKKKETERVPIAGLLKERWGSVVLLSIAAFPSNAWGSAIVTPLSIEYLAALHVNTTFVTSNIALTAALSFIPAVIIGVIASYKGKRKLFWLGGYAISAIMVFPYFMIIHTGNTMLITLSLFVWFSLSMLAPAVQPSAMVDLFPTKYRSSATGLISGLTTTILGLFLIFVETPLTAALGPVKAVPYIALAYIILVVVALVISALYLRGPRNVDLLDTTSATETISSIADGVEG